jgi:hypothetical protein
MDNDTAIPGFTASPALQQKLDSLDDHLQPIVNKGDLVEDDDSKPTEEEAKDDNVSEDEKPEEGKEAESEPTEESEEASEDDEGYAIDGDGEADEEDNVEEPDQPEQSSVDTTNLTPEQRYIIDKVTPLAITVRGVVGDGELKEYKVLAPEQLPQGFRYVDEREASIANKQFALIENEATRFQNEYRNQQSQKQTQDFVARENAADTADIGRLQREHVIPMFKLQQNDPNFENDPGVKLVQEVLDFKEQKNNQYSKEYNAGRPFKHIGFEEAFLMYQREHPESDSLQKAEDQARKDQARRTKSTKGTPTAEVKKVTVHSGISSRDLDALIEERTRDW